MVDLFPKPVTRKLQIGDVGDIAARKSTYSYSIKLPRTSNNVQILDMLGVIGNTSRKPFELIVADYVVDGIPLVINGYAVISQTSEFFEINIYDGIIDLGERLKGKKISDLPFSDLNHYLTTQEYVDSFSNTEGFIYAAANFGLGGLGKVERQAPSIFSHTVFRKIFESNGINVVGDFFNTNEKFLSEVLTPVKGYEVVDTEFVSTPKGGVSTNTLSDYDYSNNSQIFFDEQFSLTNNGLSGAAVASGNKIVFSVAGTYKFALSINYSSYETYLNFQMRLNGSSVAYVSLAYDSDSGSGTKTRDVVFTVEAGDEITFFVAGSSGYDGNEGEDPNGDDFEFYTINYNISATGSLSLQTGGQLIQVSEFIGDLGQLDFLKDIIRRYGIVLHPIRNSSDYRFIQLESILSNRNSAEDWTEKLKEIGKEKYVSGYAQTNYGKYKYPEEIVVPNNDGEMIIDNDNAKIEKTIISSVFEIPNTAGSFSGTTLYSIPIWGFDEDSNIELKETAPKTMRIVYDEDASVNFRLFTEVTGITVNDGIPFLSLESMSMEFYFSNYYKAFKSLIEDYKEVDFVMNLSVIDIFNLDFFRLKYLRQTGRFYYLNNVTHTPNKLAKVKMIEISKFPVNQPPSQIGNYSFSMSHDSTRTITASQLLAGYADPELDEALKIKIIDGFNSNLVLRQDGVEITSEIEILVADLALTVFDALGGLDAYSQSWTFTVADSGSGEYSSETGIINANVLELTNQPPNANAGSDQTQGLYPQDVQFPLNIYVNGSGSFDNTGDIVSFRWSIQSKPNASGATLTQNIGSASANLEVPNEQNSVGNYVLKLRVTDEYGLSDEDTVQITINYGDFFGGDGGFN